MSARTPALVLLLVAAIVGCAAEPAPTATTGSPLPTGGQSSISPPTSPPATVSQAPTPSALPTASPSSNTGPTASPAFASSSRLTARPIGSVPDAPLGYLEYLPPGYGDGVMRPLLLYLHGSGESGDGSAEQLPRLANNAIPWLMTRDVWPADRPFIVLMPQHQEQLGSPCMEPSEIARFLRFSLDHYDADRSHVYLTGVSCGAIGAWDYLGRHTNDLVAAAVLIAGDGRPAFARAGCDLGRVAIWAFHGEADTSVDVQGSIVPINGLNACTDPAPIDARLTTFPGIGHAIWNPIYDLTLKYDIYSWLLEFTNPPA